MQFPSNKILAELVFTLIPPQKWKDHVCPFFLSNRKETECVGIVQLTLFTVLLKGLSGVQIRPCSLMDV